MREGEAQFQRIIPKQAKSKQPQLKFVDSYSDSRILIYPIYKLMDLYNISRYELEESSEFLQPVDSGAPVLVDEDDYAALEDIKTKLYPGPPSNTHYTYDRVPWTLKIRKEVFSPSETLNSPLAINLIFCQVGVGLDMVN